MDTNLKTAYHATLAAMPYLREVAKAEIAASGRPAYQRKIVFTSSVAALMGNPGQFNYTAAKGALIAATKTLARELGPFGINVNAVAPGFIETRLTQARPTGSTRHPEQMRQLSLALISLGRFGAAGGHRQRARLPRVDRRRLHQRRHDPRHRWPAGRHVMALNQDFLGRSTRRARPTRWGARRSASSRTPSATRTRPSATPRPLRRRSVTPT